MPIRRDVGNVVLPMETPPPSRTEPHAARTLAVAPPEP